MSVSKPRVFKEYQKLDKEVKEQIKLFFPNGFQKKLITFKLPNGKLMSALPFETEDKHYMVKMTEQEAIKIIKGDSDYDDFGKLKKAVKERYEEKYDDSDDDDDDEDLDFDEIELDSTENLED